MSSMAFMCLYWAWVEESDPSIPPLKSIEEASAANVTFLFPLRAVVGRFVLPNLPVAEAEEFDFLFEFWLFSYSKSLDFAAGFFGYGGLYYFS